MVSDDEIHVPSRHVDTHNRRAISECGIVAMD